MSRNTLLTLILSAWVGLVSAQSLQFVYDGTALANNDIIVCEEAPNAFGEMGVNIQIQNLTSYDIPVIVEKEYVQIVEGTSNYFCWGLCLTPETMVSPRPVTLEGNAISADGEFSIHYQVDPTFSGDPMEYLSGTSIIKFHAYPADDPDDRATLELWFAYNPTEVKDNLVSFGQAYPNPASSQVNFNLKGQGDDIVNAVVYNLLGQEVKSKMANGSQSRISIDLSDIQPGIYFCSFFVNNEVVKTEKFIVKK